jgi:hypothetical protein
MLMPGGGMNPKRPLPAAAAGSMAREKATRRARALAPARSERLIRIFLAFRQKFTARAWTGTVRYG